MIRRVICPISFKSNSSCYKEIIWVGSTAISVTDVIVDQFILLVHTYGADFMGLVFLYKIYSYIISIYVPNYEICVICFLYYSI